MKNSSRTALEVDDFRLCEQVAQDLAHVRDAWSGDLSEQVIRRESPIIRRLLVDGDYSRAWRIIGLPRQPIVLAHNLDDMLGSFPKRYIRYAFPPPSEWTRPVGRGEQNVVMKNPGVSEGDLMIATPGYLEGQGIVFAVVPKAELDDNNPEEFAQRLGSHFQYCTVSPMWLTIYLDSAGACIDGQMVTRRQVIDFVANAMGGAHYDPSSNRQGKALPRTLLKPLHVKWRGATDVHAPWIEVMSIGQTVARSTDAMRFCSEFDDLTPPDNLPLNESG